MPTPIIAGLISLIPQVVTTISSVVKDKRERKEAKTTPVTGGETIMESVKEMVSGTVSSKRLLNIGGFGLIISLAITNINANGLTKLNLGLIAAGIIYSLGKAVITWLSERK